MFLVFMLEAREGQLVNSAKSSVFFSTNVDVQTRGVIGLILEVSLAGNLERYLGLPGVVGRNKKATSSKLREKVRNRISSWSSWLLSAGGKEVFIKSVLQVIPSYAMMCFLLPKSFCNEIEELFVRFWWQKSSEK